MKWIVALLCCITIFSQIRGQTQGDITACLSSLSVSIGKAYATESEYYIGKKPKIKQGNNKILKLCLVTNDTNYVVVQYSLSYDIHHFQGPFTFYTNQLPQDFAEKYDVDDLEQFKDRLFFENIIVFHKLMNRYCRVRPIVIDRH